jgi:uncharacterized protein YigA (DUF484 family)
MSDFDKRELEYIAKLEEQAALNERLSARIEKLERDLVRAREKKRFEAAKAAMQVTMAYPVAREEHPDKDRAYSAAEGRARVAVAHADALIARLSESKETEGV